MHTFKKIKWNEKELFLKWSSQKGPETQETELTSRARPHRDFEEALWGLKPFALAVLKLEADQHGEFNPYGADVRVQSVSFSIGEKTGIEGCVITCLKPLAAGVFVMNTPYLKAEAMDENDKAVMSYGMLSQIERLKDEAMKYLDGKRHDPGLFDAAPNEALTTAEHAGEPVNAIVDPPAEYGAPVLVP